MKPSAFALALLLAVGGGCGGNGLVISESGVNDVLRVMGEPGMQWAEPGGARRLAYPHGPMGVTTDMVLVGADGKVQRIENVLDPQFFSRIEAGMTKEQVLRLLGPPKPSGTVYFKARDELAWEWRYCDEWNRLARFDVLFDGTKEIVRSTLTVREHCGPAGDCWCAH